VYVDAQCSEEDEGHVSKKSRVHEEIEVSCENQELREEVEGEAVGCIMKGGFVSGTENEGKFEDKTSSDISIDSLTMAEYKVPVGKEFGKVANFDEALRLMIIRGDWLDDRHMLLAQAMLKSQYAN
jgi:hypothetical protein